MSAVTAQAAHDELLRATPEGAKHEPCHLCAGVVDPTREVAEVAGEEDKVFTEAQHVALVESAVARETASLQQTVEDLEAQVASLTQEKADAESALTEVQGKIDVLEAEKSAAETAKVEAEKAFEDFKNELTELAEADARRTERSDAVKEAAPGLDDSYFTEERVARWAQMSSEQFDVLVADLKEAASAKEPADDTSTVDTTTQARETAAFKGGKDPKAPQGTAFGGFMSAVGKGPKAAATTASS